MDIDDERVKPQPEIVVGENLSTISVEELKKRITLLEAEITRLKAEISRKESSKDAAESFFKH